MDARANQRLSLIGNARSIQRFHSIRTGQDFANEASCSAVKILLINDYAAPSGGAERATFHLRESLRKEGHDARIFASTARDPMMAGFADYECVGTMSRWRTMLQAANPFAFRKLRQVLAEFRPDVVHVRMFLTQLSPLILPLLKQFPALYHVVWYRPVCPLGTKLLPDGSICQTPPGPVCYRGGCLPLRDYVPLMLQMNLWRRWRSAFRVIVANSEAVRQQLVRAGITPVHVISNAAPSHMMRPPLSSPPMAVFAGRLVREKGVDVLLEAFAKIITQVPDAQLLVAGHGPEGAALTSMVGALGLNSNVTMFGHLAPGILEQYSAKAWVQVVPSRWAEPFGLVAVEAMMRGTAVIGSAAGGLMEIIRHGETGFLVPPGDPESLAKALLEVFSNRALAEQLGRAGRQVAVANFDEQRMVGRFVELYHSLVRQR
jgi:glycosyltransferase involved in cell wall biosynthesis